MGKVIGAVGIIEPGIADLRQDVELLRAQGNFPKNTYIRLGGTRLLTKVVDAQPLEFPDEPMPEVLVSGYRAVTGPPRLQALWRARKD